MSWSTRIRVKADKSEKVGQSKLEGNKVLPFYEAIWRGEERRIEEMRGGEMR